MTKPFSVRIFLVNGDPAGIKVVEKSNWTGVGLVFPQALYTEARKRPELQRTGVYLLVGPGESVQLPKLYIGEGDPICRASGSTRARRIGGRMPWPSPVRTST